MGEPVGRGSVGGESISAVQSEDKPARAPQAGPEDATSGHRAAGPGQSSRGVVGSSSTASSRSSTRGLDLSASSISRPT